MLKLGLGREIITPEIGCHMAGYGCDVFSESINDDLTATAMLFDYDGEKVLLINTTVCQQGDYTINYIKSKIKENHGLEADHISVLSTHTHSGPVTYATIGWGETDIDYCKKILFPQVLKAVNAAFSSLTDVKVGVGTTESEVGINRREFGPDDEVILGQNPWGQYDPEMTVIAFKTMDDKPYANIIHYACHGTAAGTNHEISRDWSGPMIDRMEKQTGAMTVFFNGAAGDVGPRVTNGTTKGDITDVKELGDCAAQDAFRAYKSIKAFRDEDMETVSGKILLPYRELPTLEEARKGYEAALLLSETNMHLHERDFYRKVIEFYENNETREEGRLLDLNVLRIGDVVFLPFGFELFSEIGLRLRNYSKYQHTLTCCYTDISQGYMPSKDQTARNGYEIFMFKTAGTRSLTDDADGYLIRGALKIMEGLKK